VSTLPPADGEPGTGFALESLQIGGHPILQPFLTRLGLRRFFQEALGRLDQRLALSPVDAALVLVRNFALSREPLYGVPQWASRFVPEQIELDGKTVNLLNDDRLGRTLDRFFLADLRTLTTRIVVHMVGEFGLDLSRAHNDSTTITFSGAYRQSSPRSEGRRAPHVAHVPLSTLRRHSYPCPRMTRGRRGSLNLHRMTLSFTTPCRFDRRTGDRP